MCTRGRPACVPPRRGRSEGAAALPDPVAAQRMSSPKTTDVCCGRRSSTSVNTHGCGNTTVRSSKARVGRVACSRSSYPSLGGTGLSRENCRACRIRLGSTAVCCRRGDYKVLSSVCHGVAGGCLWRCAGDGLESGRPAWSAWSGRALRAERLKSAGAAAGGGEAEGPTTHPARPAPQPRPPRRHPAGAAPRAHPRARHPAPHEAQKPYLRRVSFSYGSLPGSAGTGRDDGWDTTGRWTRLSRLSPFLQDPDRT